MGAQNFPQPIVTNIEDASIALSARVPADGDEFRIRIMRKMSAGGPPETIAVIDGATIEQVMNPEAWLSMLAGGSPYYTFQVMHAKDKPTGVYNAIYSLPAIGGDSLPPNPRVKDLPEWPSNLKIQFVPGQRPQPARDQTNGKVVGTPVTEATPTSPTHGGGSPDLLLQMQREREALSEERHRMQLDAIRRESEASQKALEARLNMIQSQASRPSFDMSEFLVKAGAVLTPIATALIAAAGARREADAKTEELRMQREAEREAKRQERESSLMEKIATQSSESAKVIGVFTESLSTVARSMVQTVAMVGELRQEPPEDNSIMSLAKVAVSAWAEVNASRATQAPPPAVVQQRIAPAPAQSQPPIQTTTAPAESEEVEVSADQMLSICAREVGAHADVEELGDSIVEACESEEFIAQIRTEGGIVASLRSRLGDAWGNDSANVAYVQRLFAAISRISQAKGIDVTEIVKPAA